jgi:hypothetical protein
MPPDAAQDIPGVAHRCEDGGTGAKVPGNEWTFLFGQYADERCEVVPETLEVLLAGPDAEDPEGFDISNGATHENS